MSDTDQFLFVLGRETELCFAELETVLSVKDPAATIQNLPSGVAVVQPSDALDPAWWIRRLGGTRLIARVVGLISALTVDSLVPFAPATVRELALSSPDIPASERMKLLLQLKKLRPGLRYRPTSDPYLASGLSERLVRREDGRELLIVKDQSSNAGYTIGDVIAVQDTRAWTERDMGLPAPDAFVGMLPPKVARIMVNLAEPARSAAGTAQLLDPFCGSGQIPIEGLRVGWTVTASDIDPHGIERTETNLAWVQERSADAAHHEWIAFRSDIATIADHVPAGSIDAIVTEPDLGPPLKSSTAVPADRVLAGVATTIALTFQAGRTLLRSGGRLVIVIPIIAGNRIADRLDDSVRAGYTLRETLHYARPDSRVEREIHVLDKL